MKPSSTHSASAGTRTSLVTHLTTGSGASRSEEISARSSHRQPHHRGEMVDRMQADHESDRQRLAGRRARLVDRAQVARRVEIDAGLLAPAQHQPADADIGQAGLRIDDEIGRGRDIGRAVGAVLQMHRQRGEVGVVRRSARPPAPAPRARATSTMSGLLRSRRWISCSKLVRRDAEGARDARCGCR